PVHGGLELWRLTRSRLVGSCGPLGRGYRSWWCGRLDCVGNGWWVHAAHWAAATCSWWCGRLGLRGNGWWVHAATGGRGYRDFDFFWLTSSWERRTQARVMSSSASLVTVHMTQWL